MLIIKGQKVVIIQDKVPCPTEKADLFSDGCIKIRIGDFLILLDLLLNF